MIVWLCVDIPFVVEEPFREETIGHFERKEKSSLGYLHGVLHRIHNSFHVIILVKVFSGYKFSSGVAGYSCEEKIDIYQYPKLMWIERVSYETERFHS